MDVLQLGTSDAAAADVFFTFFRSDVFTQHMPPPQSSGLYHKLQLQLTVAGSSKLCVTPNNIDTQN
jgi:hypothetical protein